MLYSYSLKQGINQPNWGLGVERPRNFPLLTFLFIQNSFKGKGSEVRGRGTGGIIIFFFKYILFIKRFRWCIRT